MKSLLVLASVFGAAACLSACVAVPCGGRIQPTYAQGQVDYACSMVAGSRATPCPDSFPVHAWMIPNMTGGYAGCVAAFPYKSLAVTSSPGAVATLRWKISSTFSGLVFDTSRNGIDITVSPGGPPVSTVYSNPNTTPKMASWDAVMPPMSHYTFNHTPMVGYLDPANPSQLLPCVAIDPLVTNDAN